MLKHICYEHGPMEMSPTAIGISVQLRTFLLEQFFTTHMPLPIIILCFHSYCCTVVRFVSCWQMVQMVYRNMKIWWR